MPGEGVDVVALRRALARQVETKSLRAVAREVGMSPSGLQKFLEGASPYTATRRRLERWLVRESSEYKAQTSVESARAALAVLSYDIAPSERAAFTRRLIAAIEEYYEASNEAPPKWLRELKRTAR